MNVSVFGSIGKFIMQAAADCFGDEYNRCNVCNTSKCPRGITTQDPKLYRRLDSDGAAERVVEVFKAAMWNSGKSSPPWEGAPSSP